VRVGVFGTGHVGLPTAAALAHLGHDVVATDVDAEKLSALAVGRLPFYEPGLEDLVRRGLASGRLRFSAEPAATVSDRQIVFVCVGTPPRASGEANLLALEQAAEIIGRHATGGPLVVVEKSTVPAGTASRMQETLARHNGLVSFAVVSNPEFLREGCAVEDSLQPARILVGSDSREALAAMRELYAPLIEAGVSWIETDVRTAELAKHASNAFLAMKISYANALARICELAGADVVAVADAMGADPRIGRAYLDAGLGYGGYCFPKDVAAFERLSARLGYRFRLLEEVAEINGQAVGFAVQKVEEMLWNLEDKRIALLGLAFKPGTDDVRFAPALEVARRLLAGGAKVVGHDPQASATAKAELPELEIAADVYAALEGAHCAIVCTEWPEFRGLDFDRARMLMTFPILIDGRNLYDDRTAAAMGRAGFTYRATGRHPRSAALPTPIH
jgi:UDPglucose 6-dehydrogenase